ncbi:MAG: CPBP family intramembrane metalloprotease [Clostridiales bacterium]|nr:CPBP family intramembrane metalloprotease [Clostridiales bacterium]
MEQISNQKKLRPWMGVLVQAGCLALFVTAGAYMQRNWGQLGLFTSEAMFAVVSILYCLARRVKLKEMFPIKKITLRDFFGVILVAGGTILFSLLAMTISLIIMPRSFQSELTGLTDYLYSENSLWYLLLAAAVMPAICEETMERGMVLSHFRSLKKDWMIALIVGAFFGIMHMSVMRFLTTACGGFFLSLVMTKKNNLLLPMMMHFLNNGFSVVVGSLTRSLKPVAEATASSATAGFTTSSAVAAFGEYLVIGCIAPILIVLGFFLLDPQGNRGKAGQRLAVAGTFSAIMLVLGMNIVGTTLF